MAVLRTESPCCPATSTGRGKRHARRWDFQISRSVTSGTPLRKVRTEPNGYVRRRKSASITHSEEVDATGQARSPRLGKSRWQPTAAACPGSYPGVRELADGRLHAPSRCLSQPFTFVREARPSHGRRDVFVRTWDSWLSMPATSRPSFGPPKKACTSNPPAKNCSSSGCTRLAAKPPRQGRRRLLPPKGGATKTSSCPP
jgi:hypothetical protein